MTHLGFWVQGPNTLGGHIFDSPLNVFHFDADMMNTASLILFEEIGYRTTVAIGMQKLGHGIHHVQ